VSVCGRYCVVIDVSRMFWIAYYANLWVYPVLEVLGWPARILFLVMCWLLMFACYFAGEVLTIILWREYYWFAPRRGTNYSLSVCLSACMSRETLCEPHVQTSQSFQYIGCGCC